MYLVFTRMTGKSYRRRFRSFLLCMCDVFRAPINPLVCWFCILVCLHFTCLYHLSVCILVSLLTFSVCISLTRVFSLHCTFHIFYLFAVYLLKSSVCIFLTSSAFCSRLLSVYILLTSSLCILPTHVFFSAFCSRLLSVYILLTSSLCILPTHNFSPFAFCLSVLSAVYSHLLSVCVLLTHVFSLCTFYSRLLYGDCRSPQCMNRQKGPWILSILMSVSIHIWRCRRWP